jgi:hypothetical protein
MGEQRLGKINFLIVLPGENRLNSVYSKVKPGLK